MSKSKWATMAIVGFTKSVSASDYNPAAHGGVCLLQARRSSKGEILGRKVNSNGRHRETSESFVLDAETLASWQRIAQSM